MAKEFLGATVIFRVKNISESVSYYKTKLGFKARILWEHPNYVCMRRGDVNIEFAERPELAGSGVCYIHVANANDVFREFQASGVEFVGDLAERDYGQSDFRVRDPDGNLLVIGSSLPDKDALIAKGNRI